MNAVDMNYFYYELISKEERDKIDNIEKFDEYEVSFFFWFFF